VSGTQTEPELPLLNRHGFSKIFCRQTIKTQVSLGFIGIKVENVLKIYERVDPVMRSQNIFLCPVCIALSVASFNSASMAQEAANTPPAEYSVEVDAGLTLAEEFTDNVFATSNYKKSDFITVFTPWVDLSVQARDYDLSFGANAEIGRYSKYSSENYNDYSLNADGRFRLNNGMFAFGGLDYAQEHEDRVSPDSENGLEPTKYNETSGYFGLGGRVNGNSFRLGVNLLGLDFDNTPAAGGTTIDNDDRDRKEAEIGGRIGVAQIANGEVFVQGIYDQVEYDEKTDGQGYQRSSKGGQAALGYKGQWGDLSGELSFGVLTQNFDDPRFDTVTAPVFDIDLTWRPSRTTQISGVIERSLEETTISGASSYLSTSAGARLRYRVAQNLSLASYLFLTENDYQGIDRNDRYAEAGLSLRYYLNPKVYLDADYAFQQRLSGTAGQDFDEHRFFLTFGYDWEPNFETRPEDQATITNSEFYVGTQIGYGVLQSKVDGPRGSGGNLTADFGDHGAVAGFLGGYRTTVNGLVLGVEANIEFGDMEWVHDADRDFSVKTGNTYGLSGIVGLKTVTNNFLYSRFGVFSSQFESKYQRGGNSTSIDDRVTGFSFGLGSEVPLGRGLSGRIEYQMRSFSDYQIGAPLGANDDNFANLKSAIHLGLIYTFDAQETPTQEVPPTDFSGLYAGATMGHSTVQSDNSGPRPTAAAPSFFLDATRSGQGFSGGALAGYGWRYGAVYLGAEAELEVSSAGWNVERNPTGRIYSAEKIGSVAGLLRVGYIVDNSVLIYGRAGLVRAKFDTDYSYLGATINQSDTVDGTLMGLGVEYAVGPRTHLRMEYNYTDYEGYEVDYGTGVDSFESTDSRFQVTLAYKF